MLFRPYRTKRFVLSAAVFAGLFVPRLDAAAGASTRVYMLRNLDAGPIIHTINFAVPDPAKQRIISGNGKKLVITATPDQHDEIAELLPVMDQTGKETEPRRMQMEIVVRTANYLNQRHKNRTSPARLDAKTSPATATAPAGPRSAAASGAPLKPYKSVYSDEDARMSREQRVITEEATLPSTANLKLKGIFQSASGERIAMLNFETLNYTARDGGLYQNNRFRVKGVVTKVLKDKVVVTGADKIPREIKFSTTL